MAGLRQGIFPEKISLYLKNKMDLLKNDRSVDSKEYKALFYQYRQQDVENCQSAEGNVRHWQADMNLESQEQTLRGLERLYRNSLVIEPTMVCAAHCRYCLRSNYDIFTLEEDELTNIAQFCGSQNVKHELSEVLITGGDPLIMPKRLGFLVEALVENAPNITTIRIGTRLPLQDPGRINNNIYELFQRYDKLHFELAIQVNHSVELFPEVVACLRKFHELGVKIYSQNVLLKNVNDNINSLVSLYNLLRKLDVEAHYLFHCVPMIGMHHLRTTIDRGLELCKDLVNSGRISGRAKPMFAAMTDIGKITFYEGVILDKNKDNWVLLQSSYKYEDRLEWNPDWKLPETAEIDKNGLLRVWYLDGENE